MMNSLGTNLAIRKSVLILGLFMAAIVILGVGQVGSVASKPTMSFTVDRRSVHRGESATTRIEQRSILPARFTMLNPHCKQRFIMGCPTCLSDTEILTMQKVQITILGSWLSALKKTVSHATRCR
jgi:hypothetical protein